MPGWMKWTVALLVGIGIIVLGFRFAGWLLTGFFVINCLVLIIVVLYRAAKPPTWPAPLVAQAARPPSAHAAQPTCCPKPPPGAP